MIMENYTYKAFISYRHTEPDEIAAKRLHTLIETYGIPGELKKSLGMKKMGRVFRDQEELPLSTDLGADIYKALDASEWLIVMCSPAYLQSKWCRAELDYYISIGRRDRILAVLVDGEPGEAFPPQLRHKTINGMETEVEPLAADIRDTSVSGMIKKLGTEKLRILAPMLGVSFDSLRQRDRRRKLRLAAGTAAASVVLLAGFLTYALIKNSQIAEQRDIAEEQRDYAEEQRQIAEEQRNIASEQRDIAEGQRQIAEEQRAIASEQRDIALDNQLQLLIEQANISSDGGDKIIAAGLLSRAAELREQVGKGHDEELKSALEYALYNSQFDTVLTIDNDNRQFDSIVFSHSDRYLLAITNLNSACLIDAETGEILNTVSRSDIGQLDSVGFTLDDRYFYMVDSWFGYVSLYDVSDGTLFREFDGSAEHTWNIGGDVIPMTDNRLMIVKDRIVILWNYKENTTEEILPVTTDGAFDGYLQPGYPQPFTLDLSPDESSVVIGSHGYGTGMKIKSLDGKELVSLEYDPERGYPQIMFSGDGRYVAGCSGNRYYVWEAATGKLQLEGTVSEEYTGDVFVQINHDGDVLLIMSSDYLGAVETGGGKILWEKRADSNVVTEAYISPNGRYVCTSGGISGVFDILTGETLCDRAGTAFSNDSSKVLCGTYGTEPQLLVTPEAATSWIEKKFDGKLYEVNRFTDPGTPVNIRLRHSAGEIYSQPPGNANRQQLIYSSPDAKYAAQTHYDGFIEVFDISDPGNVKETMCMAEHCWQSVTDLIFHGDFMASCGGFDPRCVITDLKNGKILHVLTVEGYAWGCEFSPDGSKIIILSGYSRDTAYVYDVETGKLLYRFTAPEGHKLDNIGFTEEGDLAVASADDGRAVVGRIYASVDDLILEAKNR